MAAKRVGAALLRKGQHVTFASCAITDAETRYGQMEREILSVVFVLHWFNQYAYGEERP